MLFTYFYCLRKINKKKAEDNNKRDCWNKCVNYQKLYIRKYNNERGLQMRKKTKTPKLDEALDQLILESGDTKSILSKDGLLKQLTKWLVERVLESEMDDHLGYSRYDHSKIDNARNGYGSKNLITENGPIELEVPRDRKSEFEPVMVPKCQTRIDGLDQKILSLYAKGMSLSDIKLQLEELYGAQVSESLISKITDDVIEEVKAWQNRPLDSIYPIVFFDCLVVKVRQDKTDHQ